MTLEMEVKFRLENPDFVITKIKELGAIFVEELTEKDDYYNAPDRDFQQTDEVFRIRTYGNLNHFTYKGPNQKGNIKVREELELKIEAEENGYEKARKLLQLLGYRHVAVVQKIRKVYDSMLEGFPIHFCVDQIDGLGSFLEIEIVTDSSKKEQAEEIILELVRLLNLERAEKRSYLQMIIEAEKG